MLAGMILLSAAVGMLAITASVVLSLPVWITVAAYPVVCSLTLLLTAALLSARTGKVAPGDQLLHPQT